MNEFKLKWQTEPRDYYTIMLKKNKVVWLGIIFAGIVGTLLVRDTFFLLLPVPEQIIASLVSIVVISTLLYWFLAGIQRLGLRRQPELFGKNQLTVNHLGLRMGDDENFLFLPWERVIKAEESRNYLLIKSKKNEKILIPKRCFASPEEAEKRILFIKDSISI